MKMDSMNYLEYFPAPGQFLSPFVFAVAIYGVRYGVMATAGFLVAQGGWGRPHADAPATFDTWRNVRRELAYSVVTVLAFGLINAAQFGWRWVDHSQIYLDLSAYPAWWFWLSIPVMLALHDSFFYWLHRAMHTRWLFRATHLVHHKSVYPTAYAAYSFHPAEAVGEALIVVAIIYLVPVHPLAFLIFQTVSTAYNVYGHCGREFYPRGVAAHWLGRWLNTSTAHAAHHARGRYNYGLYTLVWDRLLGTVDPAYK
jgi:sterol desaturase/sphingolipid hydroxylase (fatty acid hydroxylase superfamily)